MPCPPMVTGLTVIICGIISTVIATEYSNALSDYEVTLKTSIASDPSPSSTIKDKNDELKIYNIFGIIFELICVVAASFSTVREMKGDNTMGKVCSGISIILNIATFGVSCHILKQTLDTTDDMLAFAKWGEGQGAIGSGATASSGRLLSESNDPQFCNIVRQAMSGNMQAASQISLSSSSGRLLSESASSTLSKIVGCCFEILRDSGGKEAASALFYINMVDVILEYVVAAAAAAASTKTHPTK